MPVNPSSYPIADGIEEIKNFGRACKARREMLQSVFARDGRAFEKTKLVSLSRLIFVVGTRHLTPPIRPGSSDETAPATQKDLWEVQWYVEYQTAALRMAQAVQSAIRRENLIPRDVQTRAPAITPELTKWVALDLDNEIRVQSDDFWAALRLKSDGVNLPFPDSVALGPHRIGVDLNNAQDWMDATGIMGPDEASALLDSPSSAGTPALAPPVNEPLKRPAMVHTMQQLIAPHVGRAFKELPAEVRQEVAKQFAPEAWDASPAEGRSSWARRCDESQQKKQAWLDRAIAQYAYWFQLQSEILENERRLALATSEGDCDNTADDSGIRAHLESLYRKWHEPDDMRAKTQLAHLTAAKVEAPRLFSPIEALEFLSENTGEEWTLALLLSTVAKCRVQLYAEVAPWTPMHKVEEYEGWFSDRPYVKPGCRVLAKLTPTLIEELWIAGSTPVKFVSSAAASVGEQQVLFCSPVSVGRDDVRLDQDTLLAVLKEWERSRSRFVPPTSRIDVSNITEPGIQIRAESKFNHAEIPGKLPRTAIGQLAIHAAWQLEKRTGNLPSAEEVMEQLHFWADDGSAAGVLRRSDRRERRVWWLTSKRKEKDFTFEACEKALGEWTKSRVTAEPK